MSTSSIPFCGSLDTERHASDLALYQRSYAPALQIDAHAHAASYFCLVIRGAFEEHFEGGVRRCTPGMVIFRPAGARHADRFQHEGATCLLVRLNERWHARLEDYQVTCPSGSVDFSEGKMPMLARQLYAEFQAPDQFSALAAEGLTLTMLAELERRSVAPTRTAGTPPWLRQVAERLHTEALGSWSVENLAQGVDVHPVHLMRRFRQHYGCTISTYARRVRITYASEQLAHTDAPLATIALDAGFYDQSHFSRCFKKVIGTTPRAYRAAHQG